ncbi:hypothetical protein VdG1_00126 [Verticillium dahliae VDG1]|nr:hypothetical protein VdG1_00126 [Verticillium dahliae VDG1]
MADFFNDLLSGIGVPTPTFFPFPGADETASPLSTLLPLPTSAALEERPTILPTSSDSPSSTPSRPADDDAADETPIPDLAASSELPLPTGPFAGRARRRAMMEKEDMEDGEIDRQQRQKWDPRVSRMGGHAVNF